MEIVPSTRGLETLEEQRKVELHTCFHLDNGGSTLAYVTEMKVVLGLPDKEFTNKKINKNTGSSTQLIRVETKKNVTTQNNSKHGGKTKH